MAFSYTQVLRNPLTGKVCGALRSDGAGVPSDPANRDWQDFLVWNAQQPTPLNTSDGAHVPSGPRSLQAIKTDLVALTVSQQSNVWTNFSANSFALADADAGPNTAALWALYTAIQGGTYTAGQLLAAKLRAVAMYVQDNPTYLVAPAFDPTINVAGNQ